MRQLEEREPLQVEQEESQPTQELLERYLEEEQLVQKDFVKQVKQVESQVSQM